MNVLGLFLALSAIPVCALAAAPARAQVPPEWRTAAQVVIGELERGESPSDATTADRPWGAETTQGWRLARAWRQHNNGNIEITLAEYLTFTALCRQPGCPDNTIEGRPYTEVAAQMKALRAEQGDSYKLVANAQTWLGGLADPTGAAAKNAAMWGKDPDTAAADVENANLYALDWLLARAQPTPAEQAATFSRFALFVEGKGWIGARCLDISRVATMIGAPPQVANCQ